LQCGSVFCLLLGFGDLTCYSESEVTTPHQTTLLRLLDSFLQSSDNIHRERLYPTCVPLFSDEFLVLSSNIVRSVEIALGSTNGAGDAAEQSPLQVVDVMLPKISEALVLVTQCLTTVFLHAEQGKVSYQIAEDLRKYVRQARYQLGQGLIESLISV
jgi:ataxin-10